MDNIKSHSPTVERLVDLADEIGKTVVASERVEADEKGKWVKRSMEALQEQRRQR